MKKVLNFSLILISFYITFLPAREKLEEINVLSEEVTMSIKKNEESSATESTFKFDLNKEYLERYFPKANALCYRIFTSMNISEVADSLESIVKILGERTWFYFFNRKHEFSYAQFLEHIIDQFKLIDNFIGSKGRVNPAGKIIILPEDHSIDKDPTILYKNRSILEVLKEKYPETVGNLYALYFDHQNDLFNQNMLASDKDRVESNYFSLEKVAERLRLTSRENYYTEALETCRQLKELLFKKN